MIVAKPLHLLYKKNDRNVSGMLRLPFVEDDNNSIYFTGLLQGLNMVSVKSVALCLIQSKDSVDIDYCYT